jgi:hypothetical protein
LAVSRLAYIALFVALDVNARLYVPSFGNADGERGSPPTSGARSRAPERRPQRRLRGQVTVFSVQSLDEETCPPILLG